MWLTPLIRVSLQNNRQLLYVSVYVQKLEHDADPAVEQNHFLGTELLRR